MDRSARWLREYIEANIDAMLVHKNGETHLNELDYVYGSAIQIVKAIEALRKAEQLPGSHLPSALVDAQYPL